MQVEAQLLSNQMVLLLHSQEARSQPKARRSSLQELAQLTYEVADCATLVFCSMLTTPVAISRSRYSLTQNISEMAKHTAIVTIEGE